MQYVCHRKLLHHTLKMDRLLKSIQLVIHNGHHTLLLSIYSSCLLYYNCFQLCFLNKVIIFSSLFSLYNIMMMLLEIFVMLYFYYIIICYIIFFLNFLERIDYVYFKIYFYFFPT